jgi:hypothetical protein
MKPGFAVDLYQISSQEPLPKPKPFSHTDCPIGILYTFWIVILCTFRLDRVMRLMDKTLMIHRAYIYVGADVNINNKLTPVKVS